MIIVPINSSLNPRHKKTRSQELFEEQERAELEARLYFENMRLLSEKMNDSNDNSNSGFVSAAASAGGAGAVIGDNNNNNGGSGVIRFGYTPSSGGIIQMSWDIGEGLVAPTSLDIFLSTVDMSLVNTIELFGAIEEVTMGDEIVNLQFFESPDTLFTDIVDINKVPQLIYVNLSTNHLTVTGVDRILGVLDSNGLSDGEVNLSGGINAIPSASGLVSKGNLEGKGWSVTVNS